MLINLPEKGKRQFCPEIDEKLAPKHHEFIGTAFSNFENASHKKTSRLWSFNTI